MFGDNVCKTWGLSAFTRVGISHAHGRVYKTFYPDEIDGANEKNYYYYCYSTIRRHDSGNLTIKTYRKNFKYITITVSSVCVNLVENDIYCVVISSADISIGT